MFLHNFYPQPVWLEFGWLKIHWYGLIIALATVAGLWLIIKLNQKYQEKGVMIFKNKEQILDFYFYLVIFGLIGARIYEVFLFFPYYFKNPLAVFKIWQGGLAIHGAILGALILGIVFTKRNKINFWLLGDVVAPAAVLGQAIGRWGNYFNQELFGLPTNLPWGIPIDLINRPIGYESFTYFHPTFLYESLLNLVLLGILLWLHYRRIARLKNENGGLKNWLKSFFNKLFKKRFKTESIQQGNILWIYLIGYSVIRFLLEFIKIDETPEMLSLRWPQVISLIIIFVGGIVLLKKQRKIN